MKDSYPLMVFLYRGALMIYPLRLRAQHRDQMLQTLHDAYQDRPSGALRFWLYAFRDLLESSLMERIHMVRDSFLRSPLAFHTLALAAILTVIGGAASFTISQMLRSGANQPQIDMVNYYVGEIASGEEPADVIPPGYVDLERSLQPVVIFYDDHGKAGPGTGYLDQQLPKPPAGVFDFVRANGTEKITWQPRPGVRLASVVQRVNGKHPGFVLAARSLRLVEEQKTTLWRMALGVWLITMLLLIGGASLLNRAQLNKPAAA